MKNWFAKLIDSIHIPAFGMLADNLRAALQNGDFRQFKEGEGIDVSISQEVTKWFENHFLNWFAELSVLVSEDDTSLTKFSGKINKVIQSLAVARGYYSKQADISITTSLKNVALAKVMLIDEVNLSLVYSYEKVLKDSGIEPNKSIEITDAIDYEGSTPEDFKWMKDKIIVNHVIFETMQDQEEKKQCSEKQDFLPWVIAGAFFLIAWSSGVTKQKSSR